MPRRWHVLAQDARRIIQDPSLLRRVRPGIVTERVSRALTHVPPSGDWGVSEGGIRTRSYRSYEEYVAHQRSKLGLLPELAAYDERLRTAVSDRVRDVADWQAKSVLCLAARLGGEVRGFRDLGAFAFGVDLNPGMENQFVVAGDFHRLAMADSVVDAIFTNSLDHALDVGALAREVRRLLKPQGWFLTDVAAIPPSEWEATAWSSIDALVTVIEEAGLRLEFRSDITEPWLGEHLRFVAS